MGKRESLADEVGKATNAAGSPFQLPGPDPAQDGDGRDVEEPRDFPGAEGPLIGHGLASFVFLANLTYLITPGNCQ